VNVASRLRSFLSTLIWRRRVEREMDEEWQFHVDARADALVDAGLTRHEAERVARAEFGDPLRWKEQGREARGLRLIHELRSDIQYAPSAFRRRTTAVRRRTPPANAWRPRSHIPPSPSASRVEAMHALRCD
jgi:hypothetical protein